MAKVKYDIADVDIQGGGDFKPAPVGLYRFSIASAEAGESKSGQPMLTVVLELTHDAKGKKLKEKYGRVWHRVPLEHWDDTAGWTFRLDELLNALGKKKKGVLDTDKLEGETGMVKLRSGKDQDDNYRPEVGKLMKLSEDEDEEEPEDDDIEDEDEDESEDDIEDESEDESEDDESEDDESDDETYSRDELEELSNKDLKEVAEEYEVEDIPQKLTAKSKPKLIDAILAAQDGDEDEEDEEEEDEEEEEEAEDYSEWSRNQLIKEARSRGLKVKKSDDDDTIRGWLTDADSSEDEDDDEDEDDEDESEEQDYSDWDLDQLKNETKERGLKSSGSKAVLIKRLEKDDASEDDPF